MVCCVSDGGGVVGVVKWVRENVVSDSVLEELMKSFEGIVNVEERRNRGENDHFFSLFLFFFGSV